MSNYRDQLEKMTDDELSVECAKAILLALAEQEASNA